MLIDVFTISFFTLNAGGITSGWGTLILAPIAGASLLLPGQTALLFASYGTVGLILQETYGDVSGAIENTSYTQSGLLGIALFATTFLAISLARRVTESTALAEKRGLDLANLAQLNNHLINRIESGIIVVDDDNSIKLMNRAAAKLLGLRQDILNIQLKDTSDELVRIHAAWRNKKKTASDDASHQIQRHNQSPLRARITKVGSRTEDKGSVIYLTDYSDLNQHIQESKLASLGRLTASIAHEIRNPLGAISHAAQLLDESDTLSSGDKRLASIIQDQSIRLNKIIESVLRLSRKDSATIEQLSLKPWVEKFIVEFNEFNDIQSNTFKLIFKPDNIAVSTDINHLHQVLWNLCTNAVKYVGMAAAIFLFKAAKQRSPVMRRNLDIISLKIPVIGGILEKSAIARFSRTLTTMFAAGVPLIEAMGSVAGATGNAVFYEATMKMRDDVSTGTQLQQSMKQTGVFPNMMVQMVSIGEESGSLDEMLSKVADFYEAEVDNLVDGLSALLEPLIMAVLGVLVGGLVIAMYLPIFKLGAVV